MTSLFLASTIILLRTAHVWSLIFPNPSRPNVVGHSAVVEQMSELPMGQRSPEDGFMAPISMTVPELSEYMGGWGRARLVWDMYRIGVDPLVVFQHRSESIHDDTQYSPLETFMNEIQTENIEDVQSHLPSSRRTQKLGVPALKNLSDLYEGYGGKLEGGVASLSHVSTSSDGTTKLLLKMQDGLEVETVIIPMHEKSKSTSTICISSQVGCRQGCTFCATGRMGRMRSLTPDEILAQFFFATKITRLAALPSIANVVFMGMGEPADNAAAVCKATEILTNGDLFHLAKSKVTVSTVAPTPQSFALFEKSPCVLAWSVHAANDILRKQLVPTTKHSMAELRQGLINVLKRRPKNLRVLMIEVALIAEINDTEKAAYELADFAQVIINETPDIKMIINLIPFNDIGHPTYRKPDKDRVKAFQNILWNKGLVAHTRVTRGDEESAACGQLTTKRNQ
jgi:23S rRNA (adenine2503-C2)-methyltransferase